MEKSITTTEYRALVSYLRQRREASGVTQVELAQRIDESQSLVSKMERCEIRIDVIQLRTICEAMGTDLISFLRGFERQLSRKS
ncbi:helix-turn-helix protein [Novipirellula aureliae]|uniref:Helix-turn-helix protein n=1 Tax=Novipirellula aureliae TaxID=2527966 RepID=A0A5C6DL87_9BACT|nr:helix-turn-helix protein [Novipirellula aureliae]